MRIIIALFCVTIIICVYLIYTWRTKYIRVVGGYHSYIMLAEYNDAKSAAIYFDKLNVQITTFSKWLFAKYGMSGIYFADKNNKHSVAARIARGYRPDKMIENYPTILNNETSYTVNKGDNMYVCLREPDGAFIKQSTMIFVLLHELSHIGNYSWGHEDDFWVVFKFVLNEAQKSGLFADFIDYSKGPIVYCGLAVQYNPLFDDNIATIE